jgi:hypothetical protein
LNVFSGLRVGRGALIRISRFATAARGTIRTKTTLTGRAEHINPSGQAKCGGVVVKAQKTLLDASLQSMRPRMTRTRTMMV